MTDELRELLERALEALESASVWISRDLHAFKRGEYKSVANALRAALAAADEYERKNPLGGPASVFRAASERIEAGEDYDEVLRDYGLAHVDERAALAAPQTEQQRALENCRLFAARHRKEYWAQTILRFCAAGGVTGSPLRGAQHDASISAPQAEVCGCPPGGWCRTGVRCVDAPPQAEQHEPAACAQTGANFNHAQGGQHDGKTGEPGMWVPTR